MHGSEVVELSTREVEILRCLRQKPGEIFSRDYLITRFWGVDFEGCENVLTVTLHRLREKLGTDAPRIVTAPRKGYFYAQPGPR